MAFLLVLSQVSDTNYTRGIVGPMLVYKGIAFGHLATEDPKWDGLMNYNSLSGEYTTSDHPSPRFWLLWPGVLGMVVVSFTELLCQWRIFWLTGKVFWRIIARFVTSIRTGNRMRPSGRDDTEGKETEKNSEDETDIVGTWMWLPGLVGVVILSCLVMSVQYGMAVKETLLALFLTAFFSFLAIQSTGATGKSRFLVQTSLY